MSVIVKPRLINFFGEPIAVVETEMEVNGQLEPVLGVVARRLVEQLGLNWSTQLDKLKDDEDNRYGAFEGKAEGPDGKMYTSTIIPLTSVNAFLFSINRKNLSDSDLVTTTLADGSSFKESKKQKLIRYQDECAMVLHDYWIHGAAMNFRAEPHELESQKTYDILQTSRKRFNNMFNNLVAMVIDNKGLRGQEFEDAVKEFSVDLEREVRDAIMLCMDARELDFDKGLIRKLGEAGLRPITGMEAMHVSILENCVCDLISKFRQKEIGDGQDYSVILTELPQYFSDYLGNVGNQVLTMRSTFNRGKGLFVQ
ncbi:structural protein [Salmonella phage Arash]|nr:structural protein [Salmonella phage Arash]